MSSGVGNMSWLIFRGRDGTADSMLWELIQVNSDWEIRIWTTKHQFIEQEQAMTENWAADVGKYVPNADEKAIAGIVRYCGIALQKRDSSLVAFTDKEEVARVRDHFLKKKLGLTAPDPQSAKG